MLDDDVDGASECFGYRLQCVKAYRILARLYATDVVALIACQVGEILLGHALLFAEVGNALAYPLSLFFLGHTLVSFLRPQIRSPINQSESSLAGE